MRTTPEPTTMSDPGPKELWAPQRRVLADGVDAARRTYARVRRGDWRRLALAQQTELLIRIERLTRP